MSARPPSDYTPRYVNACAEPAHARIESTASFLLELAGQGAAADGVPNCIVMGDDPAGAKYTTLHRHPTHADCMAHVLGHTTLGGYLTWGDRCRAIAFDADTSGGFALLTRAADRLRASGAAPQIEQTVLPSGNEHAGGGKLWLVFTERVKFEQAIATAEHHAPELREISERWPGSQRVRLPGGLYRHGLNIWSELRAYAATDDGWYTAYAAIETIMENLTPASWVRPIAPLVRCVRAQRHARLPATIHEGECRNIWMARVAGSLRRWGLPGELIGAALAPINAARCDPPLDDDELTRIAYGMERYPAGPPLSALPSSAGRRLRVRTVRCGGANRSGNCHSRHG